MEKLLITMEQKKSLELIQEFGWTFEEVLEHSQRDPMHHLFKALNGFTKEQFACLFLGYYDLDIPQVGDWYYSSQEDDYFQILSKSEEKLVIEYATSAVIATPTLRYFDECDHTKERDKLTLAMLKIRRKDLKIEIGDFFLLTTGSPFLVLSELDIEQANSYWHRSKIIRFYPHERGFHL